jgi:hypothetical protein
MSNARGEAIARPTALRTEPSILTVNRVANGNGTSGSAVTISVRVPDQ